MNNDVVQKEFQGGLFRLVWTLGVLALSITVLCLWHGGFAWEKHKGMDPQLFAEAPVSEQTTTVSGCTNAVQSIEPVNRSIRESEFYLVAAHNLAEGTDLRPQDLKVVRMPGLRGYELAFFSPEAVIGMSTSHPVPEGQPVLPYHVESALSQRKCCKSDATQQ